MGIEEVSTKDFKRVKLFLRKGENLKNFIIILILMFHYNLGTYENKTSFNLSWNKMSNDTVK